jgi:hypothetical protein
MDADSILLLVVPAMLVLLAAGGLAGYIEKAVYQLNAAAISGETARQAQLQADYSRRRSEFARLRDEKAELDADLAAQMKERANLQDQVRRLADRQSNLVAEAGYPAPGLPGFYFRIEGPAAVMPFAGLASVPTATGGKRRVRLVVWAATLDAAQAVAMNWAGDGTKVIDQRPFAGKVFWHEA